MKLRADNLIQKFSFSLAVLCGVDNGVPQLPLILSESFDKLFAGIRYSMHKQEW